MWKIVFLSFLATSCAQFSLTTSATTVGCVDVCVRENDDTCGAVLGSMLDQQMPLSSIIDNSTECDALNGTVVSSCNQGNHNSLMVECGLTTTVAPMYTQQCLLVCLNTSVEASSTSEICPILEKLRQMNMSGNPFLDNDTCAFVVDLCDEELHLQCNLTTTTTSTTTQTTFTSTTSSTTSTTISTTQTTSITSTYSTSTTQAMPSTTPTTIITSTTQTISTTTTTSTTETTYKISTTHTTSPTTTEAMATMNTTETKFTTLTNSTTRATSSTFVNTFFASNQLFTTTLPTTTSIIVYTSTKTISTTALTIDITTTSKMTYTTLYKYNPLITSTTTKSTNIFTTSQPSSITSLTKFYESIQPNTISKSMTTNSLTTITTTFTETTTSISLTTFFASSQLTSQNTSTTHLNTLYGFSLTTYPPKSFSIFASSTDLTTTTLMVTHSTSDATTFLTTAITKTIDVVLATSTDANFYSYDYSTLNTKFTSAQYRSSNQEALVRISNHNHDNSTTYATDYSPFELDTQSFERTGVTQVQTQIPREWSSDGQIPLVASETSKVTNEKYVVSDDITTRSMGLTTDVLDNKPMLSNEILPSGEFESSMSQSTERNSIITTDIHHSSATEIIASQRSDYIQSATSRNFITSVRDKNNSIEKLSSIGEGTSHNIQLYSYNSANITHNSSDSKTTKFRQILETNNELHSLHQSSMGESTDVHSENSAFYTPTAQMESTDTSGRTMTINEQIPHLSYTKPPVKRSIVTSNTPSQILYDRQTSIVVPETVESSDDHEQFDITTKDSITHQKLEETSPDFKFQTTTQSFDGASQFTLSFPAEVKKHHISLNPQTASHSKSGSQASITTATGQSLMPEHVSSDYIPDSLSMDAVTTSGYRNPMIATFQVTNVDKQSDTTSTQPSINALQTNQHLLETSALSAISQSQITTTQSTSLGETSELTKTLTTDAVSHSSSNEALMPEYSSSYKITDFLNAAESLGKTHTGKSAFTDAKTATSRIERSLIVSASKRYITYDKSATLKTKIGLELSFSHEHKHNQDHGMESSVKDLVSLSFPKDAEMSVTRNDRMNLSMRMVQNSTILMHSLAKDLTTGDLRNYEFSKKPTATTHVSKTDTSTEETKKHSHSNVSMTSAVTANKRTEVEGREPHTSPMFADYDQSVTAAVGACPIPKDFNGYRISPSNSIFPGNKGHIICKKHEFIAPEHREVECTLDGRWLKKPAKCRRRTMLLNRHKMMAAKCSHVTFPGENIATCALLCIKMPHCIHYNFLVDKNECEIMGDECDSTFMHEEIDFYNICE